MKALVFSSSLNSVMTRFIELKQYSGSNYRSQAKLLLRFDRYLKLQHETLTCLRPLLMQSYLDTLSHLCNRGLSNHYCVLHQFSVYLNQYNPASYVLPPRPAIDRSYSRLPYIFSLDQVACLLDQCRKIHEKQQCLPSMYCTVFSLLYSTGMRINEVLSLDVADYHAENKLLHIRQGKFRKERYVVLSTSCAAQLAMYMKDYKRILNPEDPAPLFINIHRRRLGYQSVKKIFHKMLAVMGISKKGRNGPRIHDLRHTFAVHRLLQWIEFGHNLNAKLPLLSTYMGHINVTSTQVYLQATNELLEAGSRRFRHWALDYLHEEPTGIKGVIS